MKINNTTNDINYGMALHIKKPKKMQKELGPYFIDE